MGGDWGASVNSVCVYNALGDPDKVHEQLSSHHCSYQNPSTALKVPKFNKSDETLQKTFQSSLKYKSNDNDVVHITTVMAAYDSKKCSVKSAA